MYSMYISQYYIFPPKITTTSSFTQRSDLHYTTPNTKRHPNRKKRLPPGSPGVHCYGHNFAQWQNHLRHDPLELQHLSCQISEWAGPTRPSGNENKHILLPQNKIATKKKTQWSWKIFFWGGTKFRVGRSSNRKTWAFFYKWIFQILIVNFEMAKSRDNDGKQHICFKSREAESEKLLAPRNSRQFPNEIWAFFCYHSYWHPNFKRHKHMLIKEFLANAACKHVINLARLHQNIS